MSGCPETPCWIVCLNGREPDSITEANEPPLLRVALKKDEDFHSFSVSLQFSKFILLTRFFIKMFSYVLFTHSAERSEMKKTSFPNKIGRKVCSKSLTAAEHQCKARPVLNTLAYF